MGMRKAAVFLCLTNSHCSWAESAEPPYTIEQSAPLDRCGPTDPLACTLAMNEAKADNIRRAVDALARGVCDHPQSAPPPGWKGPGSWANANASTCLLLTRPDGDATRTDAIAKLQRACALTDTGRTCLDAASRVMDEHDELHDPAVALALIDRGCTLGDAASCDASKALTAIQGDPDER